MEEIIIYETYRVWGGLADKNSKFNLNNLLTWIFFFISEFIIISPLLLVSTYNFGATLFKIHYPSGQYAGIMTLSFLYISQRKFKYLVYPIWDIEDHVFLNKIVGNLPASYLIGT